MTVRTTSISVLLVVGLMGLAPMLWAQEDSTPSAAQRQPLSPEQRSAKRDEMRQRWESMSDEERATARNQAEGRRQGRRERWEAMTPDEQAVARERMQTRREGMRERWQAMTPEQRDAARARTGKQQGTGGRQRGGGPQF